MSQKASTWWINDDGHKSKEGRAARKENQYGHQLAVENTGKSNGPSAYISGCWLGKEVSRHHAFSRLGVEAKDVVEALRKNHPNVDFHFFFASSAMRPDGGILSVMTKDGRAFPILIAEKKNQGTNDLRIAEGKTKQAKGNAIERLGKNVIGFRTAMKTESIFPFVCFGDGCDFDEGSSILDRVVTIAQFGRLNVEHLHDQGSNQEFDRGTFYFRVEQWTEVEMAELSLKIAEKSVFYYFSKYGEESFI